ncbi:MAG: hypothetical protein DME93_03290 [Verrucomicrobia bacterium]|nr:MAG: hypothetical protein DME93_03290 [Verrucomicrobiota bacterium]
MVVPNYHQIVIQNENYQRRQRNRQSLRVLVRFNRVASVIINRADHSAAELAGVETVSQWWIPTGEQSGLQTHIGTTESVSLRWHRRIARLLAAMLGWPRGAVQIVRFR